MRTKDKYSYSLVAVWTEEGVECTETNSVHPVLNKMEVKYSRPSDEMYYEKTFNSEFRLVGGEYSLIASKKVSTKFTFIVKLKSNSKEVARCTFRKSDCTIDINHKEVKVNPKSDNPYDILKGKLDDEIDIKPLKPNMAELSYKIRPSYQSYLPGSKFIQTATISGMSQSQISEVTDESTITASGFGKSDYYFFARLNTTMGVKKIGSGSNAYYATRNESIRQYLLSDSSSIISLELYADYDQSEDVDYIGYKLHVGSSVVYTYQPKTTLWSNRFKISNYGFNVPTFQYDGEYCSVQVRNITCRYMYCRVLVANAPSSVGRYNVGTNDAFNSGVYKFAYADTLGGNYIGMSVHSSSTPTEYGRFGNGYYAQPNSYSDMSAIGQDMWNDAPSLWANIIGRLSYLISIDLYRDRTIAPKDWYSLGGVIKVVLNKLDNRIDFDETTEYSQFLFSENNPILTEGSGSTIRPFGQGRLYILQKSNLLSLDYDVASNQNKITLRKILQFLKYTLNCYWHFQQYVDGDGNVRYKFHIEHVYYYMNGGAYSSTDDDRDVVDLVSRVDAMNGRRLSYNTNNWSYDVNTGNGTATKIQYHWMDEQSKLFDGYSLDVPEDSMILSDDTLEERTIDWFSSDIDYLLANSSNCSNDGFLVVWTSSIQGKVVPIDSSSTSITYRQQNYRLAISWLMQHILLYNIGSKYVKINNKSLNVAVKGVKSMRKSSIKFIPLPTEEITPDYKIKTEIGDGVIDSMTTDLTSGLVSADLLYELED